MIRRDWLLSLGLAATLAGAAALFSQTPSVAPAPPEAELALSLIHI